MFESDPVCHRRAGEDDSFLAFVLRHTIDRHASLTFFAYAIDHIRVSQSLSLSFVQSPVAGVTSPTFCSDCADIVAVRQSA